MQLHGNAALTAALNSGSDRVTLVVPSSSCSACSQPSTSSIAATKAIVIWAVILVGFAAYKSDALG
jgi:hypothetical protein